MDSPVSAKPSQSSDPADLSQGCDQLLPKKPTIIGIFGIPGSGKTFLWNQLLDQLGEEHYKFFEGSQVIAGICPVRTEPQCPSTLPTTLPSVRVLYHIPFAPYYSSGWMRRCLGRNCRVLLGARLTEQQGGLDAFKASSEVDKLQWRQRAITKIRDECASSGRAGVVVGHFMFWEENKLHETVLTARDWDTFTHILYLDVPAELVEQRRRDDSQRSRPAVSVHHLLRWQFEEKTQLRRLCGEHGVLFSCVSPGPALLDKVTSLLHDFRIHDEGYNLAKASARLDEIFEGREYLETVLVFDGDRTLAAEDTGELFALERCGDWNDTHWENFGNIFGSPLGYSYTAFRQAMLLYEEMADARQFKRACYTVASQVTIHPDFLSLLDKAAKENHVGAVIITCGLGYLWETILEVHDLQGSVRVIGGGKLADKFVVTAAVKATLVECLKSFHGARVWAFGDGPLDLPMLQKADEAVVVVRQKAIRSKTMEKALLEAIDLQGLRARQLLLPGDVEPRLDVAKLPLVELDETTVLNSILRRDIRRSVLKVIHESDSNSARMLMTPTRDARLRGPGLREAHRHVGRYLAIRHLSEVVGVEEHPIPHVQGHQTGGFRLRDAQKTCIVALMRGGEPMAMGVSDVVPEAMFIHAQNPHDLTSRHLENQTTVLLVDSVVNSGASVVGFYERIRSLKATARIVVVAGVVQAQCVSEGGLLYGLGHDAFFDVVALRLSDNAFTGQGGTDTGNRLFNTTHLPSKR